MPDIHWDVGEGADRETITQVTSTRRSRRSWIALFIVIVIGTGLGIWYRSLPEPVPRPTPSLSPTSQPTATRTASSAKLFETIDREAQALAGGDLTTFLDLHIYEDTFWIQQFTTTFQAWGRPGSGHPVYSIVDFNLRTPDRAWADVRQFRNGHSFRETRFYVRDNDRWLRDNPDPFFWRGEIETFDTPHLHVIYAAEDYELARIVTDRMEELYNALCVNLNCAVVTLPLTYTVNMNNYQQVGGSFSEDGRTLSISSPRVMGIYEGSRPPSDELSSFMSQLIAQRIAFGRAVNVAYAPPGLVMMFTIANWANSRVVNWAAAEKLRANSLKSNLRPPLPLENLWEPVSDDNWREAYMEAFVIIYFIEQQYGEGAIPKVLGNIGQAQSFADLIEKSLDVSFDEFDQKWQAWLKQ